MLANSFGYSMNLFKAKSGLNSVQEACSSLKMDPFCDCTHIFRLCRVFPAAGALRRSRTSPFDSSQSFSQRQPPPMTSKSTDSYSFQALSDKETVTLEWSDLSLTIPDNTSASGELKTILHPMSGAAYPGQLLAVMGSSGAGKSTLLDILAGRLENSTGLSGSINTNGAPINMKSFRSISGYVMQSDALFPLLTVKETMQYASSLRVKDKTAAEKVAAAENTIKLLQLEKCRDTVVVNTVICHTHSYTLIYTHIHSYTHIYIGRFRCSRNQWRRDA